jgi:hypothetical protein
MARVEVPINIAARSSFRNPISRPPSAKIVLQVTAAVKMKDSTQDKVRTLRVRRARSLVLKWFG